MSRKIDADLKNAQLLKTGQTLDKAQYAKINDDLTGAIMRLRNLPDAENFCARYWNLFDRLYVEQRESLEHLTFLNLRFGLLGEIAVHKTLNDAIKEFKIIETLGKKKDIHSLQCRLGTIDEDEVGTDLVIYNPDTDLHYGKFQLKFHKQDVGNTPQGLTFYINYDTDFIKIFYTDNRTILNINTGEPTEAFKSQLISFLMERKFFETLLERKGKRMESARRRKEAIRIAVLNDKRPLQRKMPNRI